MNVEINYVDVNIKDEIPENENKLDENSKSNGFLYIDINDYHENNLDGIEIKQEEEQVGDFSVEKSEIETHEIYFEENLPLNSVKNLANHSHNESYLEKIYGKSKTSNKKKPFDKSVQKENISVKSKEANRESNRYKLRTRTWLQKVDFDLFDSAVKSKKAKSSNQKKITVHTGCDVTVLNKKNMDFKEEKTNFECLNCKKRFCNGSLLNKHLKLCRYKKKGKNLKHGCKKNESSTNSQLFLKKESEKHKITFFKCDKCNRTFTEKCNLVTHILKNNCSLGMYSCAICEKTFVKKSCLKKHIIAHLNGKMAQCHKSFQPFENHKSMHNHSCIGENCFEKINPECRLNNKIKSHLNDNVSDVIFNQSNKSYGSLKFCDNQLSEVSCSTIYKCQICKKIYKGIISYEKHLKSHRKNVKLDTNNENYINLSNLSDRTNSEFCHKLNIKSKKSKYKCDTCGKEFLKLVKLKIHILNIHQGVNYQCDKCNMKFPNQEDLDSHMSKMDCKSEDLCTCQTCGKMFAKRDYLKKHQYMHMNVLFKCKYCYCAFMKEKSFKRHMEKMNCSKTARKIRMSEFNYKKCRLCDTEYETEEELIKHFRTSHIGLEPHQCFCCDSCLPSFQDLQNHIHQHNIQKYTCNLCGKPYTSQEGFRKHRLKHKGAEFKCKFCESEFLNESRFKFHEKTCKKNPESGYEPSLEKEKPKKKDAKPKQSRQLHWESRIIMKRLRGDPKLLSANQTNTGSDQTDNTAASVFFDEVETDTTDDRGWFNNYYKTDEDDITFGLKKGNKVKPEDCESEFDVSEFLQTGSAVSKKKTRSSPGSLSNIVNTSGLEDRDTDDGVDNYSESPSEDSSTDSDKEIQETDLPIDYNPKKCRLCVINFDQEYELIHHFIKTHPGEHAHKCPQCEVQSPLYAQLKEHLKIHGIGIGIFNCDNCSKQFKSEKKMNSHNIRCKGIENKIKVFDEKFCSQRSDEGCKRCGKKFHSKFGYRRHKQLCKKRKNKIKNSEKFYKDIVKLGSKDEVVSDNLVEVEDFQLSYTEKEQQEEEDEVEKVETVKSTNLIKIPQNNDLITGNKGKSSSVKRDAPQTEEKNKEEVKGNYTGEPPLDSFPCRLCDKKFQYERGIVMHFKSTHPGHKPLICHVCNMHLADKLKEHLKTHGIGEEFVCELCGKRFNQKFLSKIHEMWHQGVEYKCNNCKQKFLNKEKMDKHIGENRCSNRQSLMRLPCDICGKSYRSKFGLSKHYITHTPKELRPVKNRMNCEYCGKWFEYNNGLQRHRRIHTGERPFCCRFCPKAFAQEGNCKAHERIHTGESKPRKKKQAPVPISSSVSINIPQPTALAPELSSLSTSLPPNLPPAVSAIDSIAYPGHINLYIYNNIDPNEVVH